MSDCLFCRVVSAQVPAATVYETDRTLAFRDISPQAPSHVLVIPKAHFTDVADLADADPALLSELMTSALAVARSEGLEDGFRLVFNTGKDGGQTVSHLHVHVLGGRALSWPPG